MAGKKMRTNEKRKLKMARSWAKNQAAKVLRKAEQAKRERFNQMVGSTGKQRNADVRKLEKFLNDTKK